MIKNGEWKDKKRIIKNNEVYGNRKLEWRKKEERKVYIMIGKGEWKKKLGYMYGMDEKF